MDLIWLAAHHLADCYSCLSVFNGQSHPRLVVEDTATSRSKDKGKERASDLDDTANRTPLACLRCLNCSSVLLSYPADSDSSPIAPKSTTGTFTLDLSPSSKLVAGAEKIAELSDKDKNPDWSDVFRLVMPSSSNDAPTRGTTEENDADDVGAIDARSSSMDRRSSSSDRERMETSETTGDKGDSASSPAARRTSSLRRTNSGSGTRASSAGTSTFHSAARARIKRDRQELEDNIARMRKEFEAKSKRYIEQADTLASKLSSAEKASKRTSSPSATKGRSLSKDNSSEPDDTSNVIVIRGGFDPPKSESTSPSQSHNAALGSYRTPITSPHLATAGNFPALFGSMSGTTATSTSSVGEPAESSEAKKDGIVQPTQPQSPTFRRSRSPSPSRDTSKGRSGSRDRSGGEDRNASSKMERGASDDQQTINANTSKRPTLNLTRDVSNLEHDLKQKKADKSAEDGRGRNALPTHSVLRNKGQPTNVSSSYTPRGSVPRQRGNWLRLNGLSPSPPANRLMLDRPVPDNHDDGGKKGDEGDKDSTDDQNKRINLSKHRHVSFKEPEPGSSVEASPAPAEAHLAKEDTVEEQDEVPFDMDEDIQHLADEADLDEEDAGFVNVVAPDDTTKDAEEAESDAVTRDIVAPGSVSKSSISISLSGDKKTKAGDSLSALLNDPSSFIGSLKSRNYGVASLSGRSPYDQDPGQGSSSPKDKFSLSEQAQRLRDLLALDAPSHRGTKSKRDKAMSSYLQDRSEVDKEADIHDDELDSLAPVSALATSLPVAIGFQGVNKKEEYDYERKTSVPQRENMLVPRLYESGQHRPSKLGHYSPSRLPSLGEESESASGSRGVSPAAAARDGKAVTVKVPIASVQEDDDEARDEVKELLSNDEGFVPPHVSYNIHFLTFPHRYSWLTRFSQVWKFRDRPVSAVDMLGTSVHDYE